MGCGLERLEHLLHQPGDELDDPGDARAGAHRDESPFTERMVVALVPVGAPGCSGGDGGRPAVLDAGHAAALAPAAGPLALDLSRTRGGRLLNRVPPGNSVSFDELKHCRGISGVAGIIPGYCCRSTLCCGAMDGLAASQNGPAASTAFHDTSANCPHISRYVTAST